MDEHAEGGVSVHYVTSELDGGELILQRKPCQRGIDLVEV